MRRHNAQEHRLRQKHPGRVLLSATQADRFREDAGEGETALQALPVRGSSDTRGLQERLLQRRRRDRVRLQGEVQNHGECQVLLEIAVNNACEKLKSMVKTRRLYKT